MSKNRIKKFRETWEDDEWGNDSEKSSKDKKKRDRKDARKHKLSDRWFDDDMKIKRSKE
jgi:hypothetical protein|tara:strand:+ start:663 stop:839 length:177 start_codon:yes stop_codon:yes gene_type:complete